MYNFKVIVKARGVTSEFVEIINNFNKKSKLYIKYLVFFDKQKFQLNDEIITEIETSQSNKVIFFYGNQGTKVVDEIINEDDIIFFMDEGDTVDVKYLEYLNYFFEDNKNKCKVVMPDFKKFVEKNNIFFLNNGTEFSYTTKGVAVLSATVKSSGLLKYSENFIKDLVAKNLKIDKSVGLITNYKYSSSSEIQFLKFSFDQNIDTENLLSNENDENLQLDLENEKFDYKFSCIILSNEDDNALEKTLKDVVSQSIGFTNNLQVIIVGNEDVENIYGKSFVELNDENCSFIENKSINIARNEALANVRGEYITFLKSGEILKDNYFKNIINAFEKNKDVNIAVYSENVNSAYWSLEEKNNQYRVINIFEDSKNQVLNLSGIFLKNTNKSTYLFENNLIGLSEIEFIHKKFIENKSYLQIIDNNDNNKGVIEKNKYFKFKFEDFAILSKGLVETSKDEYGVVTKYTQNIIMNIILDIFNENIEIHVSKDEINLKETLQEVLSNISDDVIKGLIGVSVYFKAYLFEIKYQIINWNFRNNAFRLVVENKELLFVKPNIKLVVENKENLININGTLTLPYYDNVDFALEYSNEYKVASLIERSSKYFFNNKIETEMNFEFEIPFLDNGNIDFYLDINGEKVNIDIHSTCNGTFKSTKDFILHKGNVDNQFKLESFDYENFEECTKKYISDTLTDEKFADEKNTLERYLRVYPIFARYKIWLFIKSENSTYDNIDTFFEYCTDNETDKIDKYIVTFNASDDEIEYGSDLHKLLYLFADKIIVSEINDITLNPFNENMAIFEPFIRSKIVNLPNEFVSNIEDIELYKNRIECTSVSSLEEVNVDINTKIIGRPKMDLLEDEKQRIVLIAPNYNEFTNNLNDKKLDFKNTKYCIELNKLLSSQRLADAASIYGYALAFLPHKDTMKHLADFETSSSILLMKQSIPDYAFASQGAMVITDTKDIAYDFAYLEKPVMYYNFDGENIVNGNFGEVLETCEQLVDCTIEYMKNNGVMKEEYMKKKENFFEYSDLENCSRLYSFLSRNYRGN